MAADPPGASSHRDDATTTDEYHHERPLVCSNPPSYAPSSWGSAGSSLRTRLLLRHDDYDDGPPLRHGAHAPTREIDQTPLRRTLTGFTAHEAYFDDPHYSDPVESVCGGGASRYSLRHSVTGASSRWEEDRPDPSVADERQIVKRSQSSGHSGHTQELSMDDMSDNFDEDEDNGEEHYRQRPPTTARRTRPPDLDPPEKIGPTEERRLAMPWPRPPGPMDERRLVLRPERNFQPEERRVKSSHEVVATIKNQLALADTQTPIPPKKYNGYEHCFITVEDDHRFLVLYTFLRSHQHDKVIIFFSTAKSTQYYARLLQRLKFDDVRVVHNGQSKERFLDEFFQFSRRRGGGILCVPDFQGGDINVPPSASWIVQFEPCADPSEYIFRVGRISTEHHGGMGAGAAFNPPPRALLFLTPSQFGFLKYFRAAGVRFSEYEIPRVENVQRELVRKVRDDGKLGRLGAEAYEAYLVALQGHEYRDIYNVHGLDPRKVARCFGFERPPKKEGDDNDNGDDAAFEGNEPGLRFREGTREQNRWKPKKNEREGWMRGKKSWTHADVHADQMRVGKVGKTDPNDYKPKSIKF